MTASQGYLTTINDMHGKPKRVASYQYTDTFDPNIGDYVQRADPVKETIYHYSASGGLGGAVSQLANGSFLTLSGDPDLAAAPPRTVGDVTARATLAQQSDYVVDLRQNRTESYDGGINLNVDTFLIAYIPVPIPVPMPNFGYSLSETKTVVTSRVVHQAGVVDSASVREGAARIVTKNDSFDPLSGAALLTESDTAYGHPVYGYQMPARWTYPRMGPAYQDVGRVFDLPPGLYDAQRKTLTVTPPTPTICPDAPPLPGSGPTGCLPVGSELAAATANGGLRLTLTRSDPATGTVFAVDGDTAAIPTRIVVTRSGNRNLLTAMTDTIRGLDDPLKARTVNQCFPPHTSDRNQLPIKDTYLTGVLSATHVTFADAWPLVGAAASASNEFAAGTRGIFRPQANYVYRADRSQSSPIDLTKDGTFVAALFGKGNTPLPAALFGTPDVPPLTCHAVWLPSMTHIKYSAAGFELENEDAVQVRSAAQYGAGGSLPFAVATNAHYDEIGFEGFETNSVAPGAGAVVRVGEGNIAFAETSVCVLSMPFGCIDRRPVVSIVSDLAHTGQRSLRVVGDQTFPQPSLGVWGGTRYLDVPPGLAWVRPERLATDVAT